jgi:hypothetical protein
MPPIFPLAEGASPKELRWAIVRELLLMLAVALIVVPLLRELPVGSTTKTSILAWLLVAVTLYWLSARWSQPLLLIALLAFSFAATLLTTKIALVLVGINRLSILRRVARGLILGGAGLSAVNVLMIIWALVERSRASKIRGARP